MKNLIGLKKIFKNQKVLITGHTGFKGAWLTTIFDLLGAKVYGISKNHPTNFYKSLKFKKVKNYIFDLKDLKKTKKTLLKIQPDFIFHLAAQAIVSKSYTDPIETWNSNLISFLNVLETLRFFKKKVNVVMITSDKCYLNIEKIRGYKENERLGGFENYSASKASCEILFKSYYESYFKKQNKIRLATARAGNVIGGGDWSKNRLIPDIIRSIEKKQIIKIRNINATRPWQHVLEPLFGYINLSISLNTTTKMNGEAFNFGPFASKNYSVKKILEKFKFEFKSIKWKSYNKKKFKESKLLNLNCNKAKKLINWKTKYNFKQTIDETIFWYKNYKKRDIKELTYEQINKYLNYNG